jgi:hypothetical protein
MLKVVLVKPFTVVVKEKFEPLLVYHLGGGHSQSVLLAMEKLFQNSATLKGGHLPIHPWHLHYIILYYFYIVLFIIFYYIFQTLRYFIINISTAQYFLLIIFFCIFKI